MAFDFHEKAYPTPLNQVPIGVVMKSLRQKIFRQIHCVECGWPFADITDKAVMLYDGATDIGMIEPDAFGLLQLHCPNKSCKQYYRMEFAL